ncbi:MAG: glycosyltransferase family 9 protein, partial [Nitrospinota bacterium]
GEEDERHVEALLASAGVTPGETLIGINPSTDRSTKNWPLERFITLADELSEEFGAKIVLTGGPAEKEVTALMASRLRRPALDTTCRLSFRQTPALLRRLSLFISCDTAAMHLAYAVGVPTVALFGPGDPHKYGPWAPHNIIIARDCPCAPCMEDRCEEFICMPAITLEEVLEASRTLLRCYPKGGMKRGA